MKSKRHFVSLVVLVAYIEAPKDENVNIQANKAQAVRIRLDSHVRAV